MSCSYYFYFNYCTHCDRHDTIEIGTSAVGWQFSFNGFEREIFGSSIRSWADWKAFFEKHPDGVIRDEYSAVTAPVDFIGLVEKSKGKSDHIDELLMHREPSVRHAARADMNDGTQWHDGEGFSFRLA